MEFYRYVFVEYATHDIDGELVAPRLPNPTLALRTYNLHKETPKGYWIGYGKPGEGSLRGQSKWISKTSKKRYAYPTKEEALTNLIKRTKQRVDILKRQVLFSELGLVIAERHMEKIK